MSSCHFCGKENGDNVWEDTLGNLLVLCDGCYEKMTPADKPVLKVRRLVDEAKLPTYATDGSGGLDLYSASRRPVSVHFGDRPVEVPLGIAIEIPKGYVGLVKSRSGMAFKSGVTCFNGVIDSDYRGEVKALLSNRGNMSQTYTQGDRVAQLLIVKCEQMEVIEDDELSITERDGRGFGSTGR